MPRGHRARPDPQSYDGVEISGGPVIEPGTHAELPARPGAASTPEPYYRPPASRHDPAPG